MPTPTSLLLQRETDLDAISLRGQSEVCPLPPCCGQPTLCRSRLRSRCGRGEPVIVLDRSARLHIDPTAPHDWDQYFQFGPPGFDQRERSSYINCHFYRDTHSRRDEWKKQVLLSPEHRH